MFFCDSLQNMNAKSLSMEQLELRKHEEILTSIPVFHQLVALLNLSTDGCMLGNCLATTEDCEILLKMGLYPEVLLNLKR
jgi:hypothetical protein